MLSRKELLKKLTNISEECSDIESDGTDSELASREGTVHMQSESSESEDSSEELSTDDENENVFNMPRKRCKMQIISDSDGETENSFQEIVTAADGTDWTRFDDGGIRGRLPSTFIFKDHFKGPKKYIMRDDVFSAFLLIIHNHMMKHIKKCIEEEGRRIMKNDWTTSLLEIHAI